MWARMHESPIPSAVALFARNFFKHPRMLGSVIPSSPYLARHVMSPIDWGRARVLVEYGPGVGTLTRRILGRMSPEARLVVFETNDEFVRYLRRLDDPRLSVVHGSAADVDVELSRLGLGQADAVVSGIPFSLMKNGSRDAVLSKTRQVLGPSGKFIVYQFSRAVLPDLRRHFGRVEDDFVLLNLLPAHLFYCAA
jgi:phospholipid N-methyltransferase